MQMRRALLLLAAAVLAQASLAAAVVRVCIPATIDGTVSGALTALLNKYSGATLPFSVISGGNADNCIAQVLAGTADLTKFGGDGLYASYERGLKAYVAETISSEIAGAASDPSVAYYSVAITTKQTCDAIGDKASLASFKGRRSCHTGYRRTAGWTLPLGYMLANNIIAPVDREASVEQDAETLASYFTAGVCAPGVTTAGPARGGLKWDPLCSACRGDCSTNKTLETYVDYEGALKCLNDGAGEIAFTKHLTPFEYSSDGATPAPWAKLAKADLRLVCRTGGCRPLEEWEECGLARSATHSLVGRTGYATSSTEAAAALAFFANVSQAMIQESRTLSPASPQLLFTTLCVGMRQLPPNADFASHFGPRALEAFRTVRNLQVPTARFCTAHPQEQAFCTRVTRDIMNTQGLGVSFSCVERASDDACMKAIRAGEADMKAFDGVDIYNGMKDYNLKAIASEDYGTGDGIVGTEYFAVAVVTKQFCDGNPTFHDLKGKRSCNTGYRRSAGWSMPTGFLIQSGVMPIVRNDANIEDDAESNAAFFSGGMCAARAIDNGPRNSADGKGARFDPLCKNCKGDCGSSPATEPYYDYAGALRCLQEGAGDVAWTKHSVALDFAADGKTPAEWSKLPQGEMRLMCPSGGCAPLSQAYRCHIARAAAHAVMVRAEYPDSDKLKVALVTASLDPSFRALVFNGTSNPSNYLFKSTTRQIQRVDDDTRSYLGATLGVFQGLDALNSGGNLGVAAASSSGSSDSGNELSTGAIVGISIGCAVAGALIAVGLVVLINKRKQRKMTDLNEKLGGSSSSDGQVIIKPGAPY